MFYLLISGNSLMTVKIITDIVLSLNPVAEINILQRNAIYCFSWGGQGRWWMCQVQHTRNLGSHPRFCVCLGSGNKSTSLWHQTPNLYQVLRVLEHNLEKYESRFSCYRAHIEATVCEHNVWETSSVNILQIYLVLPFFYLADS